MTQKNTLRRLLPVLYGFFIMGFCDVVGVATSYLQRQFVLSESLAGLIPSMVFLWFLLLAVPVALWMNRLGRRRMVIVGNAVTIVGMLIPLAHGSFGACLAGFALLGIGNTILQVSLNPLLTNVVKGRALSSSLTAGQVIKALSSLSGPFVATYAATALGNWMCMFPLFAGASLLSALWLLATPIEEAPVEKQASFAAVFSVLRDRKILLFFLGIVAIVGVDVGMNTLAPKLLIERCDMPLENAGYASSVYFFWRVVGAFAGTLLLARLSDRSYYLSHILFGLATIGALYFVRDSVAVLAAIGAAGFAFSSIFAVIYSQALKHMPAQANEISGLMITGVCGGAVVPPLMGLMTDAVGSQAGSLVVLTLFVLYLAACGFALKTEKPKNDVPAR